MTTAVIISVPKLKAKLVCDNVRTGGPGGEEAVFATEVIPWVFWKTKSFTILKLWDTSVHKFGGICRRRALAGGKRVFEDLNQLNEDLKI